MNSFIVIFGIIVAAYGEDHSSGLRDGPCLNIKNALSFDIAKFSGNWYGAKENSLDILGRVNCSLLTLQRNGANQWAVLYSGISQKTKERLSVTATAKIVDQKTTIVNYNLNSSVPLVKTYWVMSTDYVRKAIVVSCEQVGSQHQIQIWSNKRRPKDCSSDDDKEDLARAMENVGINVPMTPISQLGCVYY